MIPMIAVTATTTVPIIIRQSGRDVAGTKNGEEGIDSPANAVYGERCH